MPLSISLKASNNPFCGDFIIANSDFYFTIAGRTNYLPEEKHKPTQMKKLLLGLMGGCLFVFSTNAQTTSQDTKSDAKSNIKLNILALLPVNISLQYEYTLNGNSGLCMGVSYLPERHMPGAAVSSQNEGKVEDLSFSGFSITPEYRYYFKGNGPKGLYLAGYVRYAKYTTPESDYKYDSNDGTVKTLKISGDYTVTVGGIMLGSQWLLGDKFTLDWWIIGAAFGSKEGKYSAKGVFSSGDQQDIKDNAADITGPFDVSVTTSGTEVDLVFDNNLPAIRAFGLCIGYRF